MKSAAPCPARDAPPRSDAVIDHVWGMDGDADDSRVRRGRWERSIVVRGRSKAREGEMRSRGDRVSVVSGPRPAGAVILRHRGCGSGAAVARDARFRASRSTGGAFRDARPSRIRRSARGPTATASPRRRFDRSTRGRTCPTRKNCAAFARADASRGDRTPRDAPAHHRRSCPPSRASRRHRAVRLNAARTPRAGHGEVAILPAGRGCFTSFHLLPSQTPH